MSLFKVWSANLKINIINRFSYDIRIILKQLWISTQHVRRRFHIQIDLNLKKCPPTINQDVIYNPSQSSPNLNHPDFCTCFLYLLLFYIVLTTILFRFCMCFSCSSQYIPYAFFRAENRPVRPYCKWLYTYAWNNWPI
jgi:hypothetical protein